MIAVVIPAYKVKAHVLKVIAKVGPEVGRVYVVDDACPEQSGKFVQAECKDPRVTVLFHDANQGVGGATLTGFVRAWKDGANIAVKLDGDEQMDASLIPLLVRPIAEGKADYAKGNRFFSPEFLSRMPSFRLLGNSALSFISKISSGYWRVMDPTNGFLAIETRLLGVLPVDKIDRTYFFESDMLFRLNTIRAVVADVPMRAVYGSETSNLKIWKILVPFTFKHTRCFIKRMLYNYILRDFNLGSVQGIAGVALTAFGTIFGLSAWRANADLGRVSPVGTVMVAALPVLVGIQLILSAINYDILSEPRNPLHLQL